MTPGDILLGVLTLAVSGVLGWIAFIQRTTNKNNDNIHKTREEYVSKQEHAADMTQIRNEFGNGITQLREDIKELRGDLKEITKILANIVGKDKK